MGMTRFPYGTANGFRNQFYDKRFTSGTAGNISGTTAPNVTFGDLFYTNNTGAVTISAFSQQITGGFEGGEEGRLIKIFMLDTMTTISNNSFIKLAGTGTFGAIPAGNQYLELMYSRSAWYEVGRKAVSSPTDVLQVRLGGTTNTSLPNVNGVETVIITSTAASTSFQGMTGGYIGQKILVVFPLSGGIAVTMDTGGNLFLGATNNYVASSSSMSVWFVKTAANQWNAVTNTFRLV